jgi:hypothetical protein
VIEGGDRDQEQHGPKQVDDREDERRPELARRLAVAGEDVRRDHRDLKEYVEVEGVASEEVGILPLPFAGQFYYPSTVGASGAIYGLLLAFALYYPTRPFLVFFIFPVQARYFVMILGGIALLFSLGGGSGVAHTAHLGGLVSGYLYLKGKRLNLISEIQYRYLKWRINRMRKKFDVYSGGRRDDYDRRVH